VPHAAQYVTDVPTFTHIPFGLLSSLSTEIRTPTDPHWQNGIVYEPLCGAGNTTFDECIAITGTGFPLGSAGPVPPQPTKVDNGGLDRRGARSFTVFAEADCGAPGYWDRAVQTATELLNRVEEFQVETAFWTGVAGGQQIVWPHLAANAVVTGSANEILQTSAVVVSGSTLDPVEGLGALEAALGSCYTGVGVIHVPRILAPAFANDMLITREGQRYRTANGNVVVFGSGYTGSGPDGTLTPGAAWIYATGYPMIYRSDVLPARSRPVELFDRSENTVKAIAERVYVIGWDCCHFAARITTGGVSTGTFGQAT